jgi:hypothetical protein
MGKTTIHNARHPTIHIAVERAKGEREKSRAEASTPTQIVVPSTPSATR